MAGYGRNRSIKILIKRSLCDAVFKRPQLVRSDLREPPPGQAITHVDRARIEQFCACFNWFESLRLPPIRKNKILINILVNQVGTCIDIISQERQDNFELLALVVEWIFLYTKRLFALYWSVSFLKMRRWWEKKLFYRESEYPKCAIDWIESTIKHYLKLVSGIDLGNAEKSEVRNYLQKSEASSFRPVDWGVKL